MILGLFKFIWICGPPFFEKLLLASQVPYSKYSYKLCLTSNKLFDKNDDTKHWSKLLLSQFVKKYSSGSNVLMRSSATNPEVLIKASLCLSLSWFSSVWTSSLKRGGGVAKGFKQVYGCLWASYRLAICMSKLESTPSICRLLIVLRHLLVFVSLQLTDSSFSKYRT